MAEFDIDDMACRYSIPLPQPMFLNMLYRYCTDLQNNKDNQGLFAATSSNISCVLSQTSGNMRMECQPCRYTTLCQERVGLVALYQQLCENVGALCFRTSGVILGRRLCAECVVVEGRG